MKAQEDHGATYVDVLLPLAIPKTYTYALPLLLVDKIQFGIRVEVPLKNKLYSGIVISIHNNAPVGNARLVNSLIDDSPIINEQQFEFWEWLAKYYCAKLGEVMNAALPSGLKLASESKFLLNTQIDLPDLDLSDDEYLIAEAMSIQNEITIDIIQDILDKKTVYPLVRSLMRKRVLIIKEEMKHRYRPKEIDFVRLLPPFDVELESALELAKRSEKQARALLALMSLAKKSKHVAKKAVYEMSGTDGTVVKALAKKGIIEVYSREISRLEWGNEQAFQLDELSEEQHIALTEIKEGHDENKVALIHGVTGSGKTRIYVELILEQLKQGGQVLLLLPEIALTTQIVARLKKQIGESMFVFHSKVNDNERVEIWNAAMFANKLFVGARSALFLPFSDLRLVIIDEEHDPSYKQDSPNPKYQGRDSAIMLAKIFEAKVLLGTATPSLETILNCRLGKYKYIRLHKRYGNSVLPSVEIVDMKEAYKKGLVKMNFSRNLLTALEETIEKGEQAILFQNRRGFAPIQRCNFCGWTAECPNCDVTLTYHKVINDLKCHYCGYRLRKSDECPSCGNHEMTLQGIGTQRVEENLQELMPNIRIGRFDYDTTRSKGSQEKLLTAFKLREIDVLVGTQMITKGFDFDHISLVGILNADGILSFPDFRAAERSFQLFTQVAGRAGRRQKPGRVLIQAFRKDDPVLQDVLTNNSERFYERELEERNQNTFPPFYNLIAIWIRHLDFSKTKNAAVRVSQILSSKLGKRVQGPIDPPLVRVRNQYQQVIYIKLEKTPSTNVSIKSTIIKTINHVKQEKECKPVRFSIDVDPY